MKIILLIIALGPGAHVLQAQHLHNEQVPGAALEAFQRHFPAATNPEWNQKSTVYEVHFAQQQLEGGAVFTPTGNLVETQSEVTYHELPPLARTAMGEAFPHREIDKIFRIVSATGTVTYAALVCRGKDKDCETTLFDQDGRPLPSPR